VRNFARRGVGALDRFWFADGSAERLAALRITVGVGVLLYLYSRLGVFANVAATSPGLYEPAGPLALLLRRPISPEAFRAALVGTLVANVAFMLGWRFRWTGPTYAGALLLVLSYRNSWSMVHHFDNLVVLHVLVLGLTRSADAWSLDARRRRTQPSPPTWEYGYPVRLLCAVTVVTYLLAAIAKVAGPLGWGWALGEGLRGQVGVDALRKELLEGGSQALAYVVYQDLALATALGVGTLALELGAAVALVNARAGRAWAVAAYAMHWGIYAVMGIAFWYHLAGLPFLPFLVSDGLVTRCGRQAGRWWQACAGKWRPVGGEAPAGAAPVDRSPSR
jgi:hypothetical protein